ncbi:MAG: hypothetical protein A2908_04405 [Candidatus Staskawiczbacteria bacterium RIFCSPLOWO2_01_FULL_38_12b]|uniref:DUF5678 domain-containing protein n=1 Tax=Candidatus Staskawiczbacteria bacterium RIFCSPLOWO2_01_FULL_38_12b TaxID=1802214 RepID=A0A1G2IBJ5_9BACT|nr:MAG: hypothetical protein A2908_04405 [Candidatus Staskawiczbacteria bacterium RIFCSPLOWO2_01_FULL_38_12b]
MEENLVKTVDIGAIVNKGKRIYEKIKSKYQPKYNGKFLAIEVDSKDVFFADSSVKAVEAAKKKYPDKVFFVVKIGFSVNEIFSRLKKDAL